MASKTTIAWATRVWNPTIGCSRVSEGCRHCYAERWAARFDGFHPAYEGVTKPGGGWSGRLNLASETTLDEPLRRRKPERYFVNSMSDLFHEAIPDAWIWEVFTRMAMTPRHRFMVLTKRPERMREYLTAIKAFARGPLPNVALGVSVEDQRTADARIAELRETPAALRFLSGEPMLGPIDLGNLHGIDWVIVGGESGPGARPFKLVWASAIVQQTRARGVQVFMKQLGEHAVDDGWRYETRDKKGEDSAEWPEDLRVRQVPERMRLPGEPADLCRPEAAS